MISIKVPARICFFGDHQDYLGLPVIAGTINRFINLRARSNKTKIFNIKLIDLNESLAIDLNASIENLEDKDYFRSCLDLLTQKGFCFDKGFEIEIWGNVPVNAGLSSSSALVVCWLRFLVAAQQGNITLTDKEIGHLAYKAEVLYFNQPGGLMDQYTIAQGGMLYIDTENGDSTSLSARLGTLIVAESGISKKTLEVLKDARVYAQNAISAVKETHPDFDIRETVVEDYEKYLDIVPNQFKDHWYAAIHNYVTTKEALKELRKETPELKILGDLMNRHQHILENQIQNTPKEMTKMMDAASNAGAFGAKIIGSGGGGCMVAITNEDSKINVINAFLNANAVNAYEIKLTR